MRIQKGALFLYCFSLISCRNQKTVPSKRRAIFQGNTKFEVPVFKRFGINFAAIVGQANRNICQRPDHKKTDDSPRISEILLLKIIFVALLPSQDMTHNNQLLSVTISAI